MHRESDVYEEGLLFGEDNNVALDSEFIAKVSDVVIEYVPLDNVDENLNEVILADDTYQSFVEFDDGEDVLLQRSGM